ncbi:MAG: PP2C family protein-serine/threonine phosphatase [Capsulimonadaceae bacterium]
MVSNSAMDVREPREEGQDRSAPKIDLTAPMAVRDCLQCQEIADESMVHVTGLVRDLEARLRRATLLNAIGNTARSMVGVRTIKIVATSRLGEYLGADRCYFVTYDVDERRGSIELDWHRQGFSSVAGVFPLDNATLRHLSGYHRGTRVVNDRGTNLADTPLPFIGCTKPRSLIHVPLLDAHRMVGALVATIEHGDRLWARDDVEFVENVAAITRSAIDFDLVRRRGHALRGALRAALVPSVPIECAGIDVAAVYRPADAELGAGTDFYDVFPVQGGRTALVVGRVAGPAPKPPLDRVASLRSALRFALYGSRPLGDAVDKALFAFESTPGPATSAFVAVYDPRLHRLEYLSWGAVVPLLRRASTARVTVLGSSLASGTETLPALGVRSLDMQDSDTLLICSGVWKGGFGTRGLDAGAGRHNVHAPAAEGAVARLAQVLRHARRPYGAAMIVDAVMAGDAVDDAGKPSSAVQDVTGDVCLLAAVFSGGTPVAV